MFPSYLPCVTHAISFAPLREVSDPSFGEHSLWEHSLVVALRKPQLQKQQPRHMVLYLSIALLTVSLWSAGTIHKNFSRVPTGPPQQGKHIVNEPGALEAIWSSIAFFACSFMASIAGTADAVASGQGLQTKISLSQKASSPPQYPRPLDISPQ